MAKISLRAYNREIENMIEGGHMDEAIAHSRYILKKYPKHIDSYRLLGKAYLETQRYSDASDILQRVLSSLPDDFVAHLGMSIIREDEGNLDAAIWHMERAFEVQPSNAAIQAELKRLYGRRDGLEPPKIHLTRGALARMYAKGNLHRQAIGELRAALAEDPQRPDLLVLLARMYKETGQRVAAVETCSNLLNKLPYCLEANQILAEILPETERASEAKIYRQRVETLDPYAAHTSPSHPSPGQVPDSAVMLEKYEWTPGESPFDEPGQPEWAASLGVEISDEGEEQVPDWLGIASEEESQPEEVSAEKGELPDWLSEEEGETQIESHTPSALMDADEEDLEDEIAPAEIPDWLQSMAPEEEESFEEIDWSETEDIDWTGEDEDTEPESVELPEMEEGAEKEVPDWLRELDQEGAEGTYQQVEEGEGEHEPGEVEIPDWLTAEEASVFDEETEIPDWLQDLEEPEEPQPEAVEPQLEDSSQAEPAEIEPSEEEIPEWMQADRGEEITHEEEIPDWMQEIQASEFETEPEPEEEPDVAQPEALETQLEEPSEVEPAAFEPPEEEIPEWMQEEEIEAEPEGQPVESGETEPVEDIEAVELPPEAEVEPLPAGALDDEDAALAWLESLAEKQGAAEEELLTSKELRREGPPDWVQELSEEEAGPEIKAEEAPEAGIEFEEFEETEATVEGEPLAEMPEDEFEAEEAEEEIPDWLRAAQVEEESPEQAEEIPEWLHGAEEGPPPEEVEAVIEEQAEEGEIEAEIPSWLDEMAEEEQALPDWLSDFEGDLDEEEIEALKEEQIAPSKVEAEILSEEEREIPDWLRDLDEEAEEEPAFEAGETQPTEEAPPVEEEEPILGDTQPVRVVPEEEQPEPVEAELEEEREYEAVEAETQEIPDLDEIEEEATRAWLEGLAVEQGADEEELLTAPEQALEEPPEWLQALESEEREDLEPEPEPIDYEIAAEVELEEEEVLAGEELPEAGAEEIAEETVQEEIAEVGEEVEAPVEELPQEAETELETEELAPEPEPQELIEINTASLAELERIPGIGFTMAQNIIAHRETYGPLTTLDDLEAITGIGPVTAEELKNWLFIELEPEAAPVPEDPDQAILNQAREALDASDIEAAIGHYDQLIKAERRLDEIAGDLQSAIERYPMEIEIYQALGDAYMRLDQLDKALDTYTRAEELLS